MIGGQRQRAPRSFGSLLGWEDARVASRMAVTDIPSALRGPQPAGFPDSAWQPCQIAESLSFMGDYRTWEDLLRIHE